jgi:hypothetical protein
MPDAFGKYIIVPLFKDESVSLYEISKYKPVTLTCVSSKVFEAL